MKYLGCESCDEIVVRGNLMQKSARMYGSYELASYMKFRWKSLHLSFQTLFVFSESCSVPLLLFRTFESACNEILCISFIVSEVAYSFNYLSSSLVQASSMGEPFKASSIAKFASTIFPPSFSQLPFSERYSSRSLTELKITIQYPYDPQFSIPSRLFRCWIQSTGSSKMVVGSIHNPPYSLSISNFAICICQGKLSSLFLIADLNSQCSCRQMKRLLGVKISSTHRDSQRMAFTRLKQREWTKLSVVASQAQTVLGSESGLAGLLLTATITANKMSTVNTFILVLKNNNPKNQPQPRPTPKSLQISDYLQNMTSKLSYLYFPP